MSLEIFPTYPKIRAEQIDPSDFFNTFLYGNPIAVGAKGNGVDDDWPVFLNLFQQGHPINGLGRTYRWVIPGSTVYILNNVLVAITNAKILVEFNGVLQFDNSTVALSSVELDLRNQTLSIAVHGGKVVLDKVKVYNKRPSTDFWDNNIFRAGEGARVFIRDSYFSAATLYWNPSTLQVRDSTIEVNEGTSNAISYITYPNKPTTEVVEIIGNFLVSPRMGIEVWGGGGVPPENVIIQNNYIKAMGQEGYSFGISAATGDWGIIENNIINYTGTYGIEAGTRYQVIKGNLISGPNIGIGTGTSDYSLIADNIIRNGTWGIAVENDATSFLLRIIGNIITDFSNSGIGVIEGDKASGISIIGNAIKSSIGSVGISIDATPIMPVVIGNSIEMSANNARGIQVINYQTPFLLLGNAINAPQPVVSNAGQGTFKYGVYLGNQGALEPATGVAMTTYPLLSSVVLTKAELPSNAPNGTVAVISDPATGKSNLVVRIGGAWRYMDGTTV